MKKYFKNMIIFILVLLLIPAFVMAEKIESDISSTSGIIKEFDLDRVQISNVGYTRYANLENKGPGVEIRGTVYNDFVQDVDVDLELIIYDKNKNVLDIIPKTVTFETRKTVLYRAQIYEKEKSYSLDDIKYFSLRGEFLSNINLIISGENDEFYYENLHLKINVNKNNVYDVEESFTASFKRYVDTISIGIPFRHRYVNNGLKTNNRAVISNITTDDYYHLETNKGYREVFIGQELRDKLKKNYNIKYNYNVGTDKNKGFDLFVFYLVDDYDVKVKNLSFEITFPSEVNKGDIKFIDSYGTELDFISYDVNGNVVTGTIEDVINDHTSYAIKVNLKDGYFRKTSNNISGLTIMSILLPIAFMSLSLFIWFSLNKRNARKDYKSFYFNRDINSLEMSYLHNGDIKDTDIASLVFVLANKGFINVIKDKKSYKIVKVKDYDGHDMLEKAFMKELFYEGDEVVRKDFKAILTETKEVLLERLEEIKSRKKLFMHKFLNYKLSFWVMILFIFIINTIDILWEYQPSVILVNIFVGGLGYVLLFGGYLSNDKVVEKLLYFLVSLIFIIVPIVLTSYMAFIQDSLKLSAYIVGLLCMVVIALVMHVMGNRTIYGNLMYNKINAYKRFLTNVDNKTIITEVRYNNRNLLYDVLPYAMVLGISDKWVSKFNDSLIPKPKWYKCTNFKLDSFYQDVKDIYSDIFIALKSK